MARICASQNRDIVSALILKCFSARSVAEQRLIYEQSHFQSLAFSAAEGSSVLNGMKKAWLCGSPSKQDLFCWSCLLFWPGLSATWTGTGYKNSQGLLSDCKKHEASKSRT